jgi:hypothetical protein
MFVLHLCKNFHKQFIKLLDFSHSVRSKINTTGYELDWFPPSGVETPIVLSPTVTAVHNQ